MIAGIEDAQLVYVAAKLGIADLLASGPKTGEELARLTGTHAGALTRVLRALAVEGVFAEAPDGRFSLTEQSESLRSGAPGSLRWYATMIGEDWYWRTYGRLLQTVQTGNSAFEPLFGMHAYEYLARDAEAGKIFAGYMNDVSEMLVPVILSSYDFSSFHNIVDVGGGRASLLIALLETYPQLHAVVYDLPQTVEGTRSRIAAEGLEDRCELVAGSFFVRVPEGGDAYLLRNVLHDWDDEHVLTILKNCRQAMGPSSTLLISEAVLPEGPASLAARYCDIQVMVTLGGRQRTVGELERLLEASGLELVRLVPSGWVLTMIEAKPV